MGNDIEYTSEDVTNDILNKLIASNKLSPAQINALKTSIESSLDKYKIQEDSEKEELIDIQNENAAVLREFIDAKRIEGRSNTTLYNYAKEIAKMFLTINKSYRYISTSDLRDYMAWRKKSKNLSQVTVANIRMYLMSFFKWLYTEEMIPKNPMLRIGVVKTEKHIVQVLSDEEQEMILCACTSERDKAIINLLSGSGMRVSELCGLNRSNVNFETGEVVVFGKGAKERICFLTGKAKVHLQ